MTDPVTQLQHALNSISHMFFNFVGQSARDAPPVPVGDSATETVPPSNFNKDEDARVKADQLMGGFKHLDTLVQALPDNLSGEAEQLQELEELRRRNEEMQKKLQQEYEVAEQKLAVAQDLFGALAMATLQQRQSHKLQQLQAELSQLQ